MAARFEVLEERTQSELIDRLRMAVLLQAATQPESRLGRALATAITAAADITFNEMIIDAIARRDELTAWIAWAGGIEAAIDDLSRALGIDPRETSESIAAEFFRDAHIAESEHPSVIAALEQGLKGDKEHAARFDLLRLLTDNDRVRAYQSIFCTAKLEPRKNIVTRSIHERTSVAISTPAVRTGGNCPPWSARKHAIEARDRSIALFTIAACRDRALSAPRRIAVACSTTKT